MSPHLRRSFLRRLCVMTGFAFTTIHSNTVMAYQPRPYSPTKAATPTSAPKAPSAPKADAPQSQFNTNIYEPADENVKFTDTVKLVRELDGNSEVLFMKKGGIYQSPNDSTAQSKLVESQTSKTPVTVIVNEETKKIMNVLSTPKAADGGQ